MFISESIPESTPLAVRVLCWGNFSLTAFSCKGSSRGSKIRIEKIVEKPIEKLLQWATARVISRLSRGCSSVVPPWFLRCSSVLHAVENAYKPNGKSTLRSARKPMPTPQFSAPLSQVEINGFEDPQLRIQDLGLRF